MMFQANDARKKVGSTKGMQTSVETSKLLKFRAEQIVPIRIEEMVEVRNLMFWICFFCLCHEQQQIVPNRIEEMVEVNK